MKKLKIEELVLAKCIQTSAWGTGQTDLKLGEYYVVEEIMISQSYSSVVINNKAYNSIMFEYFECRPLNIYERYSPYRRLKGEKYE